MCINSSGDCDPLLLSTRELSGGMTEPIRQSQSGQQLTGMFMALRLVVTGINSRDLHIAHRVAGDISQEERKRVAFALALATDPKLMLLDEPAGGVNPEETEGLAELIRKIVRHGITVALIEHKMGMIMSLADKILVLSYGDKIAEGTPEEIRRNPAVIDAYLGSEHAEV